MLTQTLAHEHEPSGLSVHSVWPFGVTQVTFPADLLQTLVLPPPQLQPLAVVTEHEFVQFADGLIRPSSGPAN